MNQDSTPAVKEGSRDTSATSENSPGWGDSSSQHMSNVAPGKREAAHIRTCTRNPVSVNPAAVVAENTAFERHYRISELAKTWGLGRETVRRLVKDDPGVVKIRLGRKKKHTVYAVPESAARRIHTRLLNST